MLGFDKQGRLGARIHPPIRGNTSASFRRTLSACLPGRMIWNASKQAPRCAWVRTSHGSWLMRAPKPLHLVVKAQVSSGAVSFSAWLEVGEQPGHRSSSSSSSSSSEGAGLMVPVFRCAWWRESRTITGGGWYFVGQEVRWTQCTEGGWASSDEHRCGLTAGHRWSMVYKSSTIQFREL